MTSCIRTLSTFYLECTIPVTSLIKTPNCILLFVNFSLKGCGHALPCLQTWMCNSYIPYCCSVLYRAPNALGLPTRSLRFLPQTLLARPINAFPPQQHQVPLTHISETMIQYETLLLHIACSSVVNVAPRILLTFHCITLSPL